MLSVELIISHYCSKIFLYSTQCPVNHGLCQQWAPGTVVSNPFRWFLFIFGYIYIYIHAMPLLVVYSYILWVLSWIQEETFYRYLVFSLLYVSGHSHFFLFHLLSSGIDDVELRCPLDFLVTKGDPVPNNKT